MLAGKKCIVTGASSGIGAAVARYFIGEGALITMTGRKEGPLRQLQEELGNNCSYVVADLTDNGSAKQVVEESVSFFGGNLTSVVNCAGVLHGGAFGSDSLSVENYHLNFQTNTQAVFEMMNYSMPFLKETSAKNDHRGCSITNVSSVNGKQSFGGVAAYCASKAATDMLTKCAAVDVAPFGIRVNAVNPGVVITNLQKRGGLTDEMYENLIKRSIDVTHPLYSAMQECASPLDVAHLIGFLTSDKSQFITGDCVEIDGGRGCLGAR